MQQTMYKTRCNSLFGRWLTPILQNVQILMFVHDVHQQDTRNPFRLIQVSQDILVSLVTLATHGCLESRWGMLAPYLISIEVSIARACGETLGLSVSKEQLS